MAITESIRVRIEAAVTALGLPAACPLCAGALELADGLTMLPFQPDDTALTLAGAQHGFALRVCNTCGVTFLHDLARLIGAHAPETVWPATEEMRRLGRV